MRTTIAVEELVTYAYCPERERRRKLRPVAGPAIEVAYRTKLRKVLVAFYTALADDRTMTEAELRRRWSTLWEIPVGVASRSFDKHNASMLNGLLSDEERMILRGTRAIHKLAERKMNDRITPIVIDEPYSIVIDGITIVGRHDLVFEDHRSQRWAVDWTDETAKIEAKFYLKHALIAEGFRRQYGLEAGVLTDYLMTLGDYLEPSLRHPYLATVQVQEAGAIAKAISLGLTYHRIGPWCSKCPYKPECLGVKVVRAKRPPGRPRKSALSTSIGESL